MYDLRIRIRDQGFETDRIPDGASVHAFIREYLLAFGINILISEPLRDRGAFAAQLARTGEFTGCALDAEITVTRSS